MQQRIKAHMVHKFIDPTSIKRRFGGLISRVDNLLGVYNWRNCPAFLVLFSSRDLFKPKERFVTSRGLTESQRAGSTAENRQFYKATRAASSVRT